MKRKSAARNDWKRLEKKKFYMDYISSNEFSGYVAMNVLEKVRTPLTVSYEHEQWTIADNGYCWLQQFPVNENYTVTTMFNSEGHIVQWYVDICKQHGTDPDGIPWFDDLYLDVVILPEGDVMLLDKNELDNALREGLISRSEYNLAQTTANEIIKDVKQGGFPIINLSTRHKEMLLTGGRLIDEV